MNFIEKIERYIINDKAVVIFWKDGNKTIAKTDDIDKFDKKIGFMVAVQKYLCFYSNSRNFSKTELKKIYNSISDFETYLFVFFNKYTFQDTNKSRKYLNELKIEKTKKKNKKEESINKIDEIIEVTMEEPQIVKKVFSLEKYKEWYKEKYKKEYENIDRLDYWVNECIGLTEEECKEKGWDVANEWMVEVYG